MAATAGSASDDKNEGSISGGHDGSSRTGERKAKPAEETNETSGGKSGNQASPAQMEGPSVDSAGADVRSLLGERSLHLSLQNNGRLLPDARRQKETVPSRILERFLTLSGLPYLGALSFALYNGLRAVAKEVRIEMVAASGVSRDWRSLCPTELFEKKWALKWETPQTSPVADKMCLFPLRHVRVKCSTASRSVALVVATSMCLLWNIYLRSYFEGNPDVAAVVDEGESEADEADSSDEGPPKSVTTPPTGAVGSVLTIAGNDAGNAAVPSNPASSSVCSEGASAESEDGRHSAIDAELPDKIHAGQIRRAVNISSKEVLKLGRHGSASSRADDSSTESPLQKQKLDDQDDSMGKPPAGGALTSLVGRPMLFAKTTGAPNPRAAPLVEPPTPARGSRVASPSVKFLLRSAVEAGSVETIAELINR